MASSPSVRDAVQHPLVEPLRRLADGWHIVGGCLRDAALGVRSIDLDISVPSRGQELAEQLAIDTDGRAILLGGERWASYRVVAGEAQVDVWDRRGGTLYADQERRDFTVNSIAFDPSADVIVDPFGGLDDLATRILRATRSDCFERDPQRVLRLARFSLELKGFDVDPATLQAARSTAPDLLAIAPERVREELGRLLGRSPVSTPFGALARVGVLDQLFPQAAASLPTRAQEYDALLAQLARPDVPQSSEDHLVAAVALILRANNPVEPTATSSSRADPSLNQHGLFTRRVLGRAQSIAAAPPPSSEDERRLFLMKHGHDWQKAAALALTWAEDSDLGKSRVLDDLAKTAQENPELVEGLTPLLNGHEVAEILESPAGPDIGRALERLLAAQATGEVQTRTEARAFVSTLN